MNKGNVNLFNLMDSFKKDIMGNLICHNIGKIVAFNSVTQTADIELMQVKKYNEQYYDSVLLSEVPVFIYGTPNAYITMPDLVGSTCIILTFDRNIDAFLETGEKYTPTTTRKHNITDSIALCTFKTQVDAIEDYDMEAINIGYQDSHIRVKSEIEINGNSNIKITSPTGITIDSPNVDTTGNLNVGTGVSAMVPCGNVTLTFANGILTGVE